MYRIHRALMQCLEEYRKKKLESLLAEVYQEMADENLADAQAFLGVANLPQLR
jgi:hypothetical protein